MNLLTMKVHLQCVLQSFCDLVNMFVPKALNPIKTVSGFFELYFIKTHFTATVSYFVFETCQLSTIIFFVVLVNLLTIHLVFLFVIYFFY